MALEARLVPGHGSSVAQTDAVNVPSAETLGHSVRQAEIDGGARPGTSTNDSQRVA